MRRAREQQDEEQSINIWAQFYEQLGRGLGSEGKFDEQAEKEVRSSVDSGKEKERPSCPVPEIVERARVKRKPLYLCMIDIKKSERQDVEDHRRST